MLPVSAQCVYCNLDGWNQQPVASPQTKSHNTQDMGIPSGLFECSVCYEISHPDCAQKACEKEGECNQLNGVVKYNSEMPNSWECFFCCISGKNSDYKVYFFSFSNRINTRSSIYLF